MGTPTATAYSNTGLAANTNYRFRVRAVDAAGNLSAYSAIVTSRTLAPDTTRPTAPTGLGATAAGPTRIDLNWTASTDNVGVSGYRVERCQGAGCTNFAQVGTPTRDRLQRHRPGALDHLPLPGAGGRRGRQPEHLLLDRHGDDAGRTSTPPRRRRPRA